MYYVQLLLVISFNETAFRLQGRARSSINMAGQG